MRPVTDIGSSVELITTFLISMQNKFYLLTAYFSAIIISGLSFYLGAFSCGNYATILNGIDIIIIIFFVFAPIGRYLQARRLELNSPALRQIGFLAVLVTVEVLSHAAGWMFYSGFDWKDFVYGLNNVC